MTGALTPLLELCHHLGTLEDDPHKVRLAFNTTKIRPSYFTVSVDSPTHPISGLYSSYDDISFNVVREIYTASLQLPYTVRWFSWMMPYRDDWDVFMPIGRKSPGATDFKLSEIPTAPVVYWIASEDERHHKVGYSTRSAGRRVKDMQTGMYFNPSVKLQLQCKSVEVARKTEAYLIDYLKWYGYGTNREWFDAPSGMIKALFMSVLDVVPDGAADIR